MSKKSLRTAVHLHERLIEGVYKDGSYNGATGDDRKPIFNARLLQLEPMLKPCPFCDTAPVFDEGCLSHHGLTSGGGGWSANITCEHCDYVFKGSYGRDICNQWNDRLENKE
tara:strand:- start:1858 stop:2193 length:336 start_codon:yes stop_codon:yes gene_type:complete